MTRTLAVAVLLLASCGRVSSNPGQLDAGPARAGGEQLYEADSMVIDEPGRGPVLCTGGVMESYPPQCEGIALVDWEWRLVDGEERAQETAWGLVHVVGSFDGSRLTVVDAGPYQRPTGDDFDPSVPCPEPPGGWTAPDPARTSDDDLAAATRVAEAGPEAAGAWIQSVHGGPVMVVDEETILVATFTENVDRHRAELAEIWGGPLCVVERRPSYLHLRQIQESFSEEPPFGLRTTWSSVDVFRSRVEIGVIVADEAAQARVDERYGEGVVVLRPTLSPVE